MNSVMTGKYITDTTFGIHTKKGQQPGKLYIGTKPVQIAGNNLIIDDKKYKGAEGLWNLIMNKEIEDESFTEDDMDNYKDIMITTKALQKSENDPTRPKSSKSDKWNTVLSHIWEEIHPKKPKKGSGLSKKPASKRPIGSSSTPATSPGSNIKYLPSDPKALFDRLELLLASKEAGNTGLRNELVAICDELKRVGQMIDIEYKDLNVIIND
jgi:hypothetical protein